MRKINIEEGAYFAHREPGCPISENDAEAHKRLFEQWYAFTIRDEDATSVDAYTHEMTLATKLGESIYTTRTILTCLAVLHHMPVTLGRIKHDYPCSMRRLTSLLRPLVALTPEQLAEIDEEVAFLITPRKKAEVMHLPNALRNLVLDIVTIHFGDGSTPKTGLPDNEMKKMGDNQWMFLAFLSEPTARVLQDMLDKMRDQLNKQAEEEAATEEPVHTMSPEVFEALIKGLLKKQSVVVNLYSVEGMDGLFMPGFGFLEGEDLRRWQDIVRYSRDIGAVANKTVHSYAFSSVQRAFLEVRDEHCCFPGCERRVCDIDHVVNWADGGATNPSNGARLCRSCHNAKTAGIVSYTINNGVLTWTTPDGRVVTSYSTGMERLYNRSYGVQRRARHKRREANVEANTKAKEQASNTEEVPDPAPF